MTQKKVIFYKDSGEITGSRSGVATNVDLDIAKSTLNHIDITDHIEPVTPDSHYVFNGEIAEKGAQPSAGHIFNYVTGVWELDIALARRLKWDAIKAARTAQEFDSFEWGGYVFQCDEVSQRRIQGAVQLAMLDSTLTLDWTLADNTVQAFTAAEFEAIGQALAAHVSQCHTRGRILRQEIDAATSEQDLEAISW